MEMMNNKHLLRTIIQTRKKANENKAAKRNIDQDMSMYYF